MRSGSLHRGCSELNEEWELEIQACGEGVDLSLIRNRPGRVHLLRSSREGIFTGPCPDGFSPATGRMRSPGNEKKRVEGSGPAGPVRVHSQARISAAIPPVSMDAGTAMPRHPSLWQKRTTGGTVVIKSRESSLPASSGSDPGVLNRIDTIPERADRTPDALSRETQIVKRISMICPGTLGSFRTGCGSLRSVPRGYLCARNGRW